MFRVITGLPVNPPNTRSIFRPSNMERRNPKSCGVTRLKKGYANTEMMLVAKSKEFDFLCRP